MDYFPIKVKDVQVNDVICPAIHRGGTAKDARWLILDVVEDKGTITISLEEDTAYNMIKFKIKDLDTGMDHTRAFLPNSIVHIEEPVTRGRSELAQEELRKLIDENSNHHKTI